MATSCNTAESPDMPEPSDTPELSGSPGPTDTIESLRADLKLHREDLDSHSFDIASLQSRFHNLNANACHYTSHPDQEHITSTTSSLDTDMQRRQLPNSVTRPPFQPLDTSLESPSFEDDLSFGQEVPTSASTMPIRHRYNSRRSSQAAASNNILERRGGRLKREGFQAKEETVGCGNRQCGQVKKEAGVAASRGAA